MSTPEHWEYYDGIYYDPITETYIVANEGNEWYDFVTVEHKKWWNVELRESPDWWLLSDDETADQGLWIEGIRKTLPIEWYYFKDYVTLDTNREVTDFIIEPMTLAHEGGGHFDSFSLKRSLLYDKLYGTYVTHIPLEALDIYDLPLEIPFFLSVKDDLWAEIKSVDILPLESTALLLDERVRFRVHNMQSGGSVCTRTLMAGDDLVKGENTRFSSPSQEHAFIEFGYGIYLFVETPATYDAVGIPRCMLAIQWDIADLGEGT